MLKQERDILFHGEYFINFYTKLTARVQQKIDFVLYIIQTVERVPEKFLKHLEGTDGLYEIRIEYNRNIYRIFCFFNKGNLVILLNAFQKKTQQTPKQEIKMAEKLRKEYFQSK